MADNETENALVVHIRTQYAREGVQVESTGNKTITCSLPPMFEGASDFILDLVDNFHATIDIEHRDSGVYFIIWQSDQQHNCTAPINATQPTLITRGSVLSLFICFVAYVLFTRGHAILNDIRGVLVQYTLAN